MLSQNERERGLTECDLAMMEVFAEQVGGRVVRDPSGPQEVADLLHVLLRDGRRRVLRGHDQWHVFDEFGQPYRSCSREEAYAWARREAPSGKVMVVMAESRSMLAFGPIDLSVPGAQEAIDRLTGTEPGGQRCYRLVSERDLRQPDLTEWVIWAALTMDE